MDTVTYELKNQTIKTDDLVISYRGKHVNLRAGTTLPSSIVNLDSEGIRLFFCDLNGFNVDSFSFSTLINGETVKFSG